MLQGLPPDSLPRLGLLCAGVYRAHVSLLPLLLRPLMGGGITARASLDAVRVGASLALLAVGLHVLAVHRLPLPHQQAHRLRV